MTDDAYRQLALKLDAIPNGYPATASGVELKLLKKLFRPAEARLASLMSLEPEPVDEIARRAGLNQADARRILKAMAGRGLIGFQRADGQLAFCLMPFIVGFYESQLPRMDAELALLFEQYYQEAQAGVARDLPSIHRVIPVGESIPVELEVFPYERASDLISRAKSWGVRECICRVQQRLIGKGCDHPVEVCLTFAPIEGAFDHSDIDRAITEAEALAILRLAEASGLVHSTRNTRSDIDYICNCCACCCGILRSLTEFNIPTAVARSDFRTVVDDELCVGCGDCLDRCPFHALSMPDLLAMIDPARCMGCGLCASACSTEALHLERRPAGEIMAPPATMDAWRAERTTWRSEHHSGGRHEHGEAMA